MSAPEKDVKTAVESVSRLVPSFRRIAPDEEARLYSTAVPEAYMVQYGYHDGSEHTLSKHFVRYIEPTEGEYDQQVEYDMDEQGVCMALTQTNNGSTA